MTANQPNFVFIMTDTQGTNIVGSHGHPQMITPRIDGLAAQGIRFENAYTTCPLCTPARSALFSGIYSHSNGAWTNTIAMGSNIVNMGQRFRDGGYDTGYVGKWHLDGHDYFGSGRCAEGWDESLWYDFRNYFDEYPDRHAERSELNTLEDLKKHNITAEYCYGHHVTERAIEFLERERDNPFVLVVSYDEPHGPFTCPPEYVEMYSDVQYPLGPAAFDDLEAKPDYQRGWASIRPGERSHCAHMPMYWGCNTFIDHEIGRVVDALDACVPDNTFIIYTSDHGEMMGSHGLWGKCGGMYEEITHVPLIVRAPRGARRVATVSSTTSHIDLMPTMLDLAGLEIPASCQGQSLVGVLEGTDADDTPRDAFIEYHRNEHYMDPWGGFYPIRCIVSGQYKLSVNLMDSDELYDLGRDPAEVENLIGDSQYADIRDNLHRKLIDWMYQDGDPFRSPAWERRPWQSDRRLFWSGGWMGQKRAMLNDGYAPKVIGGYLAQRGVRNDPGERFVEIDEERANITRPHREP